MKDIVIIGSGGFGREVAWLIERIKARNKTWNLVGFLDDNPDLYRSQFDGYPVLGNSSYLAENEVWAVCAIGSARVRKKVIERLSKSKRVKFATLIDPDVIMSNRVTIGEGSIICAGSIITVDIKIGRHVIINLGCTIGHDAIIGDYVTMYPNVNVSGMVEIGECTEAGTGTQIKQGVSICSNVIMGAGAVAVRNIDSAGTYVGVPVRKVK